MRNKKHVSASKDERKVQAREEKAIDRAIEETKDNANRVIREVRRDVPENTATFHEYQEQNIRAARDMANTFLDSQKEVAKSLHAAYRPMTNSGFISMMFWPLAAMNPQTWIDSYVKASTNIADVALASVRLQNELTSEMMESTRIFTEVASKNMKELGQLNVANAKIAEQMSESIFGTARAS